MSRLFEREIARKLAEREDFEPPAGLLEKIKNEIPPEVAVGTELPGERRNVMPSRQRWLIAASLIAMVGAGVFALRLRQQSPAPATAVSEPRPAPAAVKRESDAVRPPAAPAPVEAEEAAKGRAWGPFAVLSPPSPPPPPPRRPREKKEVDELRHLGYLGNFDDQRLDQAAAAPAAIPEPAAESGVEMGVPGGVVGGVVGGTPGGVVAAGEPVWVGGEAQGIKFRGGRPRAEAEKLVASVVSKSAGINPFVETADDALSTFGLDVDTASYTVARRYLTDGNLPDPRSVRVEEFVNFFDYGDPPPARGDFAIKAEGGPTPFLQGERHRLLRFNIRARQVSAEKRRPAMLIFVVDVSGSMDQGNRLGLVKQSLSLLLDQLRPTDRIGLVTFGDEARVLLEPTSDREAVRAAIDRLAPEGSTNTEAGLTVGYEMADRNFKLNAANRIILCSDGVANVGRTGPYAILGTIGREARRGIELTTLGFGMGNYNDHLMEQLADRGDGRYAYIDTLDEAKRVLVEELTGTLQTIAKDAKVQVELNPAVVARYRLLGYENRDIADERFRDDRVDAGEIGAGHGVTALYEIELRPEAAAGGLVAALHLRYRAADAGNTAEAIKKLHVSELAPSWEAASPGFRLAAVVGQFAEILRQSPWAKGDLSTVAREARRAAGELAKGGKASELADLAAKAARIRSEGKEKD
jgi:Ca-activated chloride channel family protein